MIYKKGVSLFTMKTQGKGKKFCFRLADLAHIKGISKRSVSKDIKEGKLIPNNLDSVIEWICSVRYRRNKGKPLPWLEGKRGRKRISTS